MRIKILVTGKNRSIVKDVCSFLQNEKGLEPISCEPYRNTLFDVVLDGLPPVVIICLGDENEDSIAAYNVIHDAVSNGECMVVVVTNNKDEEVFIRYSRLERVLFLPRPVSFTVLREKLREVERMLEKNREDNLAVFREYVNEKNYYARKTVLIVDDDPDYLAQIKEQLEEFYRVICVRSGIDAYKVLVKEKPDLILLDYLMPDENGPAVLRRIQASEDWCDIPVIFLTGVSEKNAVLQTLTELRPQGYVVKPAKRSELVAKIIDAMEQESAG